MLFVIVMEAFSCMVGKILLAGLLFELSVDCLSRGLLAVSSLLFANNTPVFCEDREHIFHLQYILIWVELLWN